MLDWNVEVVEDSFGISPLELGDIQIFPIDKIWQDEVEFILVDVQCDAGRLVITSENCANECVWKLGQETILWHSCDVAVIAHQLYSVVFLHLSQCAYDSPVTK